MANWWRNQNTRRKDKKKTSLLKHSEQNLLEVIEVLDEPILDSALEAIDTDQRKIMSDTDLQINYIASMLTIALALKEIRELENVKIKYFNDFEELATAFSAPKSVEMVNTILAQGSNLLDEQQKKYMMHLFKGGVRTTEGYKPLTYAQVEKALKIYSPEITQ